VDVRGRGRYRLADVDIQRRRPAPVEALHDSHERFGRCAITGVSGQTFTSASFTFANATECQGGSPRFNVVTNVMTFFPGLQQRHPDHQCQRHRDLHLHGGDARSGREPNSCSDRHHLVGQRADRRPGHGRPQHITFNGQTQVPMTGGPTSKDQCKHGGWRNFGSPSFKNQGKCVCWFEHHVLHHSR
jgi:hypothetical protein